MVLLTNESFQLFTTGSLALTGQTINISGPAIQYAGTFKPGSNINVSGLMTYIRIETGTSPAYWYGLKGFAGGSPASAWLGSATATYTSAGWKPLYFPTNVSLTSGTTYSHIVIPKVGSDPTTSNYVRIGVGFSTVQGVPAETNWEYVDTSLQTYTSLNSGVSWTATNRLPNFILIESGGGLYGQPYDSEHIPIDSNLTFYARGYSQFGQFIKPTTNIDLSGCGFHILKPTTGNISGDAWFELRSGNSPYQVIGSWFVVGSQTIDSNTPNWNIVYGINKTLTSGIPYILSVKSHSDGDVYNISLLGAQTTANQGSIAGFKGVDSYYAYTYDSGATWTTNPTIDILFQIYGSAYTQIISNNWSQWLDETMTLTESRWYYGSVWRPETMALSDSKMFAYSGWKTDTLTLGDYFSRIASYIRTQPETLTVGDNQFKMPSKTFVEMR